jgi:hypothetical protein
MRIASNGFDRGVCSVPRRTAPLLSLDPPFEPYCGLCPNEFQTGILQANQMSTSSEIDNLI